jgi:hypothetical protein
MEVMILHSLNERIPKSDNVTQGTPKNKIVLKLKNLPSISIFREDLTLIVKLILDGFLRISTFPRFN